MKIILIGSTGQLGTDIIHNLPKGIEIIAPSKHELDLSNSEDCYEYVLKNSPDWIINSGAYTNVDKAEKDRKIAYKVNAKSPEAMAQAISSIKGKFLQISSDYVFDGEQNFPYKVNQKSSPINFYGTSKADCEFYLQNVLNQDNQLCIIRTSWLMSLNKENFVTKILKLLNEQDEIKVVYDQISSPTTTASLAMTIWGIIYQSDMFSKNGEIFPKIFHFSNSGIASWYDVAVAIKEIGLRNGLINNNCSIIPIESKDYPTAAKRPKYSVLDSKETLEIINNENIYWREALNKVFEEYE